MSNHGANCALAALMGGSRLHAGHAESAVSQMRSLQEADAHRPSAKKTADHRTLRMDNGPARPGAASAPAGLRVVANYSLNAGDQQIARRGYEIAAGDPWVERAEILADERFGDGAIAKEGR